MEYFLGQIILFAGTYIPRGFLACAGQPLRISEHEALFALIGTTYGGDRTNFNLPDLRGRLPIGYGQGVTLPREGGGAPLTNHPLAARGGAEDVSLTVSDLPTHTHRIYALDVDATTNVPGGNMLANVPTGTAFYLTDQPGGVVPTKAALSAKTLSSTGSNEPHKNIMPVLPLSYIICISGVYPVSA